MLEYSLNYYVRNRQTTIAKAKAYNAKEENKERRWEYGKHYWINNKELIKRRQKEYRQRKKWVW